MPAVDWLEGTYQGRTPSEVMQDFEQEELVWDVGRGHFGYSCAHRSGGIVVLSAGRPDMGVHVQLQGDGCRNMDQARGSEHWSSTCRAMRDKGFKATRIDIALDEVTGAVDMASVCQAIRERRFTSRWQDWEFVESAKQHVYAGLTCYLGDKSSDCYLCVYDKRAERERRGVAVAHEWLRWELRHRRAQAVAVHSELCTHGCGDYMREWFAGSVCFKERFMGEHTCREETCAWWTATLGGAAARRVSVAKVDPDLSVSINNFVRSQGQAYAVLALAAKEVYGTADFGREVLNAGITALDRKHSQRLAALIQQGSSARGGVRSREVGAEE